MGTRRPRETWRTSSVTGAQVTGFFLMDRAGIVRWMNIEGARDGLDGVGQMPSDDEILDAARAL